jgi:hypothetical protein
MPSKKFARLVGFFYLLLVPAAIFDLMYVPGKLIARDNPAQTAANFLAHETLFRFDLVVGLVSSVIFALVAVGLYRILKEVHTVQALSMMVLVLISVAQAFVGQLLWIGAFELFRGAEFLSAIDETQRQALGLFLLQLNSKGTYLSEMFWGLWLLPLGMLVYRYGFLPRFIGVWLLVNGIAYVAVSITGLLSPPSAKALMNWATPALFGELVLTLWLLIFGIKTPEVATTT